MKWPVGFLSRSQLDFLTSTHFPLCECTVTGQDSCRKTTRPGYRITVDTYVVNKNEKWLTKWKNFANCTMPTQYVCIQGEAFYSDNEDNDEQWANLKNPGSPADMYFNGSPCGPVATTATLRKSLLLSRFICSSSFFTKPCSADLKGKT